MAGYYCQKCHFVNNRSVLFFNYCQKKAKALMLVDDCGIGKTYCSKILVGQMQNAFYIDASQYKSKRLFIKALAREIGCGTDGNYSDMLENIKYYINAELDQTK